MIMAIEAEQFPVTAVWGIVVVIVIDVMDGQFADIAQGKFTHAASADPGIQFEGLFAITLLPLLFFPAHLGNESVAFLFRKFFSVV